MSRPCVRKEPVPGHKKYRPWPRPALRAWILELMRAYEGNVFLAAREVGQHYQQIQRWVRELGIDPRRYHPPERLHERTGRIIGLRLVPDGLHVDLVRDDTGKRITIWVASRSKWPAQLGVLLGKRVVVTGAYQGNKHKLLLRAIRGR